ncbi:MAG: WYL domain-containing protein [Clostridia bacterium]|nr:WYL domain-containing protein [Clostridia bacterium]
MAKTYDEKLKLLYILKILREETDADHRIFVPEIIKRLESLGIVAERKSIYRDLEVLESYGFDVLHDRSGCALVSREFELSELKILVDAVQASRFITGKRRQELTEKLASLAGRHQAKQLKRYVRVEDTDSEQSRSILTNVDWIHSAMTDNAQIRFQYFDWTPEKERLLRHDGKVYELSPWGLIWNNENYYMLAYDPDIKTIRHFRVDKMANIRKSDKAREGYDTYSRFDFSKYSSKLFGMFSGEECTVTLRCENSLAGSVIDRFGRGVSIFPGKDGYFDFSAPVIVSQNFYSWVLQFGKRMEIIAPVSVRDGMRDMLFEIGGLYK